MGMRVSEERGHKHSSDLRGSCHLHLLMTCSVDIRNGTVFGPCHHMDVCVYVHRFGFLCSGTKLPFVISHSAVPLLVSYVSSKNNDSDLLVLVRRAEKNRLQPCVRIGTTV